MYLHIYHPESMCKLHNIDIRKIGTFVLFVKSTNLDTAYSIPFFEKFKFCCIFKDILIYNTKHVHTTTTYIVNNICMCYYGSGSRTVWQLTLQIFSPKTLLSIDFLRSITT